MPLAKFRLGRGPGPSLPLATPTLQLRKAKKVFANFPRGFCSFPTKFQRLKKHCCPRAEDWAIFEDLRLRGQGQGLENVSSRTRTFSRTPPLFINFSRSNSHLASFFGYAPSFLTVELIKYRLVVPAALPSASNEGYPMARYLVQSSSSCLLMTSPRIYLGVPVPPCILTIWPSGPPPQTRSKHLLLSNPSSMSYKHGPTYGDFHSTQRSVSPPFSLQIPIKPLSNPS